jgi:hypothetical protein
MAGAGKSFTPAGRSFWDTYKRHSDASPRSRIRSIVRTNFAPDAAYQRAVQRERKFRPRMERAVRAVFEAQRKETVKRLHAQADGRQRIAMSVDELFDPLEWATLFELKVERIRKLAYVESAAEALRGLEVSQGFEFLPHVSAKLQEQGAALVKRTGETTRDRLRKILVESAESGESVSELAKSINALFGGRRRNAQTIARTELLKASEDAQVEGFRQSGVVEWKQWNDNRDPEVRDSHVGSLIKVVPLDQPFTLANGNRAMHPGDSMLPVGDVANCRCFVTPVLDDPTGVNP